MTRSRRARVPAWCVGLMLFPGLSGAAPPGEIGPIGTPHPTLVSGFHPRGDWTVLCQAREDTDGNGRVHAEVFDHHGTLSGDQMRPYLVWGAGSGEPLDVFVAGSDDGAHLVVVERGALILIRAADRQRTVLAPQPAPGLDLDLRAAFVAGGHLLYVRPGPDAAALVSRSLATGEESAFDFELSRLHAIEAAPDAPLVALHLHPAGEPGAPTPRGTPGHWSSQFGPGCRAPAMASSWSPGRGPQPVPHIASPAGGGVTAVPGFLGFAGDWYLDRGADARLSACRMDGRTAILASGACDARPVTFAPALGRLLLACRNADDSAGASGPLWLVELGGPEPQVRALASPGFPSNPAFASSRPEIGEVASYSTMPRRPEDWTHYTVDLRAPSASVSTGRPGASDRVRPDVRWEGGRAWLLGPGARRTRLGFQSKVHETRAIDDHTVWADGHIVDLNRRKVVGKAPRPLGVGADGRLLVSDAPAGSYGPGPVPGPLRWIRGR